MQNNQVAQRSLNRRSSGKGAGQRKQTLRKDVGSGVVDQLTEGLATTCEALDSIPTLRKSGVVIMFVILALERWTQEGSEVRGYPMLHGDFQSSLGYMRPCLRRENRNQNSALV